jgi:ABC-type antimicrobial peptide transport system permease subunit
VEFHGGIMVPSVVLVFVICLLAAWLPVWRMRRIDPAGVLRS